jgi:hypothetical protein
MQSLQGLFGFAPSAQDHEVVGVGHDACLVREPDAGNLHVRFDERDVETELRLNH